MIVLVIVRVSSRLLTLCDVDAFFVFLLHDDTFPAASRAVSLIVDVHLALWASGTETAPAG